MARPKKEAVVDNKNEEVGYANPTGVSINRDNVKVDITDEDREKFFKCFISDTRFEYEKLLFDGKVKVVFTSLTIEENNDIWRQVNLDSKTGEISNNQEAYLLLINIYRLAMSLSTIDGLPFPSALITKQDFKPDEKEPNTTYVKAKADCFKEWGTFKMSSFIKSFNEFENKLFQLEKDVTTQNFWKATE